jgi:hypothetical protein
LDDQTRLDDEDRLDCPLLIGGHQRDIQTNSVA